MLLIRAYHRARGDAQRTKVLIPDSAHGTNPATAAMCGFYDGLDPDRRARQRRSRRASSAEADDDDGRADADQPEHARPVRASRSCEVTEAVHAAGGLVYGDGANLNAILGAVKPADLGFDVLHINLHKTFSTPHGGGGPGCGPVVVRG